MSRKTLFTRVSRETLPRLEDRFPFLYLKHGRLEVDDSSIKWISSEGEVLRIPIATVTCLLLGPGTSVTHAAIKAIAQVNCVVCWVGEDSLLFYAVGQSPTSNTRNLRHQIRLSSNRKSRLAVARKMFAMRFPDEMTEGATLETLMTMEGRRIKALYQEKAKEYDVGWSGRRYRPGAISSSDTTNRILTTTNAALYALVCSSTSMLGYSPHVGFIHSGSPLPFAYDVADFYKADVCIDLAFSLTHEYAGEYDK